MSWSVIATAAIVFIVGVTCSPIDVTPPASELLPPREGSAQPFDPDASTPATDLVAPSIDYLPTELLPPKIDSASTYDTTGVASARADDPPVPAAELLPPVPPTLPNDLVPPPPSPRHKQPATLFLINVFAIKNHTAEDSNDVLHGDVMQEVPIEAASEPLAMFLLVVEDDDESSPVSLDEVAKDLEAEGFSIERIDGKDGETRLIKVNLGSAAPGETSDPGAGGNLIERVERDLAGSAARGQEKEEEEVEKVASGRLEKVRRKRHLLEKLLQKHGGGGYGGGCGGGCGGGGYYPQPPMQYPPPVYQPPPPPVYQPPPVQRPPPQPYCDPCQNGGGGGYGHRGGGGNSYSSAQASAQASASSYGK